MDANALETSLQAKLDAFKSSLNYVDAEKMDAFKEEINATVKSIKTNEELTTYKEEAEKQIQDLKAEFEKKFNDQEEVLKKQGEAIKKAKEVTAAKTNPLVEFEKKFKESTENAEKAGGFERNDRIAFSFKVDNPRTFTIGDVAAAVYPDGTTANATDNVLNWNTNVSSRIFESPKRRPNLLDGVRTEPISGGQLGAVVKVGEEGDALVVGECEVKPYAKFNWDLEYVKKGTIAVLWKESKQWRTDLSRLLPQVRRHMAELLTRKVEKVMYEGEGSIAGFVGLASAYTPQTGLTFASPSKLEAIGATIYSMMNQEYMPDTVLVNPVDYATMVHSRAADGHYDIFNNGSIKMINGNQIVSGSNIITLEPSTLLAPGQFFVGDMNEAIIGLGSSVEFSQGLVNDDFERNLVTNRLEIDGALLIPTVVRGAFVIETYAAVIPQITA